MQTKRYGKALVVLMISFAMMVATAFSAAAAEEKKATRSWEEWLEAILPKETVQEIHGTFDYPPICSFGLGPEHEEDDEIDEKGEASYTLSSGEYVTYFIVRHDMPLYGVESQKGKIGDLQKNDLILMAMDENNAGLLYGEAGVVENQARTMYKNKDAYFDSDALLDDDISYVFWRAMADDFIFARADEDIEVVLSYPPISLFYDVDHVRIPKGMAFAMEKGADGKQYLAVGPDENFYKSEIKGSWTEISAKELDQGLVYHEMAETK